MEEKFLEWRPICIVAPASTYYYWCCWNKEDADVEYFKSLKPSEMDKGYWNNYIAKDNKDLRVQYEKSNKDIY